MFIILYKIKHPLKGWRWQAHVETFQGFDNAIDAQKEVAEHFRAPAIICEMEEPVIFPHKAND